MWIPEEFRENTNYLHPSAHPHVQSQKLLSGEKRRRPISSAASEGRPNRAHRLSSAAPLALFHHLQRERATPAPSSRDNKAAHCRPGTMDSRAGGGSGLIVKRDVTNIRP
ncbi:uncharacterized protein ACO6RY_19662 [Pungitius sinensis]